MVREFIMTKEGYEKLKEELEALKIKRKEVIVRLKIAKEFGDLSENSEFEDAKNDQTFVESKLLEVTEKIKHAKIVGKVNSGDKIGLGSKILVESDLGEEEYELVSPAEATPLKGLISIESPFGKAFLNAKAGDKVHVNTPDGVVDYKIIKLL
ncbi:MAG: transcription elongation factor GreA [Patescibacteria group bacterium]|jgi:transcription elongation factor GreA